MERINLSIYTEQMLKKKLQELRQFIPYDVYILIEQIINKATEQHFIFKSQIEEILSLLHELEQDMNIVKTNTDNRIILHNQMHDYEVTQFRKILMLMIASKMDTEEKTKTNGIIF